MVISSFRYLLSIMFCFRWLYHGSFQNAIQPTIVLLSRFIVRDFIASALDPFLSLLLRGRNNNASTCVIIYSYMEFSASAIYDNSVRLAVIKGQFLWCTCFRRNSQEGTYITSKRAHHRNCTVPFIYKTLEGKDYSSLFITASHN